jgi:2-methylcitrate dehydratase PrpD
MDLISTTRRFAQFIASTSVDALPPHLFEHAKDFLVDHVGVAFGAIDLPWCRIIRARALADGGSQDSTVYGGGKVAARNAALANATIAHAIELDDTHIPSLSHMSAVVFPAALAVAEARGAGGREFLTAYILGCEAMGRIGRAAGQPLLNAGFHPTSTNGVFGAAAAAAVLMRLDAQQIESAFGLALSMASGAMQFALEAEGTMVKRLHAGLPAERGILAAQLAAEGFSGPGRSIEGERGFLKVFAAGGDSGRVVENLGNEFMIDDMSIKLNACCLHFASLVDAVSNCVRQRPGLAADVERIEVSGPKALLAGHMEYRPRSVMAAQYSLPYVTAAALLLDPQKPESFEDEAMARPDMLALSDRVKASEDNDLQKLFPAKFSARVRIVLRSGEAVESAVEDARGTAANPVGRGDLEAKFRALTGARWAPDRQDDVLSAIADVDRPGGIERLVALLGSDPKVAGLKLAAG